MKLPILFTLSVIASVALCADNLIDVPTKQPPRNMLLTPGPYGPAPETVLQQPNSRVVPVVDNRVLDSTRPTNGGPALLAPKDFFGRAYNPEASYYDPFNSALTRDGLPSATGDKPFLPDDSGYIQVQSFTVPDISVAEEVWVTLILMRDGEIVYPRAQLPGSTGILEVRRSEVKESPYLYLQAVQGRTELNGQFIQTSLDIEVVDRSGKTFDYKFKVKVVPASDRSFKPTIKVDLVDQKLPPIYGASGSRYSPEETRTSAPAVPTPSQATRSSKSYSPGSVQFTDGRKFTREDKRKYFPVMIGMAKAYSEAIAAGAKGYGPNDIIRFQPSTIIDGRPTAGTVPAFRNSYDGQTYYLLRGYFFPRYDAMLYELSFKNSSNETLWWDYSLLRIVPGFEPSTQQVEPTVISPEYGETTPPGRVNTIWVLLQGRSWLPNTPVRFAFPPMGMESRRAPVVQPHNSTPEPAASPRLSLMGSDNPTFR